MVRHTNQSALRDLDPRVLAEIERIGAAVDRFVGQLSAAEAREFMQSVRVLEQVDDELWK